MAERLDVSEELVRLETHLAHAGELVGGAGRGRPQARLRHPGDRARAEHDRLEGPGRGRGRAGHRREGGAGEDARAGPERRVSAAVGRVDANGRLASMTDGKAGSPRGHPGRDLVPLGRGQDHAGAPPGRAGAARVLGLVHDAAAAPRRERRRRLQVRHRGRVLAAWSTATSSPSGRMVHGSRYGTAVHTVNRALEDGKDYLFDVDYQGGAQIRRQWPDESVLVFILPPSMAELERRLRRRATDSPEAIDRRLATAKRELEHFAEYDYLVVNDNLETALKELSSIYVAARCTRARREHYGHALLAEARRGTGGRRPRRNERRSGDSRLRSGVRRRRRHRSHRTQLRLRRRAPRRPEAALGRSLRRPPGRRRPHHLRAAPGRAVGVRGPPARLRRGHQRDRRGHRAAVRHRDPVPGRGRHQAGADPLDDARGAPGRELPQDAAGDGARHPRHPDQARRSRRQHADAGAHAARQAGAHLARDARDLRAARQPPRYPVDEGRARGSGVPVPRARGPFVADRPADRDRRLARAVHRRGRRPPERRRSRRRRSRPRSRAAPSTSGRSSRR